MKEPTTEIEINFKNELKKKVKPYSHQISLEKYTVLSTVRVVFKYELL